MMSNAQPQMSNPKLTYLKSLSLDLSVPLTDRQVPRPAKAGKAEVRLKRYFLSGRLRVPVPS